ncbi:DUF2167 domain-containing protein [Aneurinibacillus uraniidurans]|uniref:DUF2167 domain-containing protein n=1 Tax=Aneurinibacillus uraniidurans TaxID=2966586 RepID=UPI002348F192|nr:DUF2167 domain-containing protein [Aneurinibacillus sp. B1]WCN38674.1 DUF2167 domain-containing protein [Aneurinibacillus sp. B1]
MRFWLRIFVVCTLLTSISSAVLAEVQVNWIKGGKPVQVGDKFATFDMSPKLQYLHKDDTIKLQKEYGNTPTSREIGSIYPVDRKENWFVVLEYDEVGHIKDEEKGKIDADAILQSYKDGSEEDNKTKNPEDRLQVIGWDIVPSYDEKTHQLQWSMLIEDAKKNRLINYNVEMLTRQGYVSFILVSDPENLAKNRKSLNDLILSKFKVNEGNRYEDFNASTDKVAEYGLTGLIMGGLGLAAAKKLGLLALLGLYFKKAVILIVAALGAVVVFIKKLFTKKSETDDDLKTGT